MDHRKPAGREPEIAAPRPQLRVLPDLGRGRATIGHEPIVGVGEMGVDVGKIVIEKVGDFGARIGERDAPRVAAGIDRQLPGADHAADQLDQQLVVIEIPAFVGGLGAQFVGRHLIESDFRRARGLDREQQRARKKRRRQAHGFPPMVKQAW